MAAHLKRAGALRPPKGLSADKVTEAAQLYRQGISLAQLGDRFHVDPKTVWNALRRAGIPIRPRPSWPYP